LTQYDERGDVLHDGDETLAHERDRHRVGAHALARDAASGVGGAEEGRGGRAKIGAAVADENADR